MSQAPADWTPTYAVYRREIDNRTDWSGYTSQDVAKAVAAKLGLKRFVIRRSKWTTMGERPCGQVMFTKS